MILKLMVFSMLGTFLASALKAQDPSINIDRIAHLNDTVRIGDTAVVARYRVSITCGQCPGSGLDISVNKTEIAWLGPWQSYDTIAFIYAPLKAGADTISFSMTVHCQGPRTCSIAPSAGASETVFAVMRQSIVTNAMQNRIWLCNPFGNEIKAVFSSAKMVTLRLQVFDLMGLPVRAFEQTCPEGQNEFELDTHNLPPGGYWYVIRGGEWMQSGKLIKIE